MQGFNELSFEEAQAVEGGGRLRYLIRKIKRKLRRRRRRRKCNEPV